jgi:hypothetical protein
LIYFQTVIDFLQEYGQLHIKDNNMIRYYINRVEGKLGADTHEHQSEVSVVPSNPIYSEVIHVYII